MGAWEREMPKSLAVSLRVSMYEKQSDNHQELTVRQLANLFGLDHRGRRLEDDM